MLTTLELQTLSHNQEQGYLYNLSGIQRKLLNKNSLLTKQQLHYFDDSLLNPMNYYPKARKRTLKLVNSLKKYLFMYKGITWDSELYFYNLLITASNNVYSTIGNSDNTYKLIDRATGKNAFINLHSALSKLRNNYLKHKNLVILSDNLVDKFNPVTIHNPHVHGVCVTTNPRYIARISSGIENYLTKQLNYDINVNLTPLTNYSSGKQVVIDNTNLTDNSNYHSLTQDLTYQNKSNILAFSTKTKDINTYKHMNDIDINGSDKYVFGALNSATHVTGGKRVNEHDVLNHQHIIKHFTKIKRYKIRTKYTCNLTKLEALITNQTSLFDLSKVDNNKNVDYYRYNNRSAIGGTSEHYGWYDYYTQELSNEHRNVQQPIINQTKQLSLASSFAYVPSKNGYRDTNAIPVDNYKELPVARLKKVVSGCLVPLVIPLRVNLSNSNKIIQKNKELQLFNSS